MTDKPTVWKIGSYISEETFKGDYTVCNPVCVPRPMMGRSAWKLYGYGRPCGCFIHYFQTGQRPKRQDN